MVGATSIKRQARGKPEHSKLSTEDFPDIEVAPNTMAAGKICETTL